MSTRVTRTLVSCLTILFFLVSTGWQASPLTVKASGLSTGGQLIENPSGEAQDEVIVGEPWTGDPPVTEDQEQAMLRAAQDPVTVDPETAFDPVVDLDKQANSDSRLPKAYPQDIAALLGDANGDVNPGFVQRLSTGWIGATWYDAQSFPPDPSGAVGPTQVLLVMNAGYRSFSKSGASTGWTVAPNVFWPATYHSGSVLHSRTRYDRLSGRYFISAVDSGRPSKILIAVSNGSSADKGTIWTKYFFDISKVTPAGESTCQVRDPSLGIDKNALYIGVNNYCGTSNTPTTSSVYIIRKSSVLAGGSIVVSAFRNLGSSPGSSTRVAGISTPQGVDNYDPLATLGYFIGVDGLSLSKLNLLRINNPGGTPTMSKVSFAVAATQFPKNADHKGNLKGSNGYLNALDDRLYAAYYNYKTGRLWTAQTVGVTKYGISPASYADVDRNGMRWYELGSIPSGTPSVTQSGTSFDATQVSTPRDFLIPTIMNTGQNHTVLAGSFAGASYYIGAFFAGRSANDNPNLMINGGILAGADSTDNPGPTYNPPGDPGSLTGRKWGAYSTTTLDGCDNMSIWTIQQFAQSADNWGVKISRLLAPPPPTISSSNPPYLVIGQSNYSISLVGTSNNSSGFYDPGAGFACRISASIPGMTVNSVTYVNPTHVTVNLNIPANTTVGNKILTITNPDGQPTTVTLSAKMPTNTGISSAKNPTEYGLSATFNAVVTGGDTTSLPTGAVTFYRGTIPIGTSQLNAAGQTSLYLSTLPGGTHQIKAVYAGDATHPPSTSVVITQTVNKAYLDIAANPASREYGKSNPAFTFSAFGFRLGEGIAVLSGKPAYGTTANVNSLPGTYPLTISQGTLASSNYAFSGFAANTLTITKAGTITKLLTPYHAVLPDQPVTITVKVAPGGTLYPASQPVTISEGGTVLTTLTLDSNGSATWSTSWSTVSTHTLSAAYAGDANFSASTSTDLVINVDNYKRTYLSAVSK